MLNLLRAVSVDQLLYMVRGYHTYRDIQNPLENGLGQYIGDTALTTSMQLLSYHDGHVIRYLPKGISIGVLPVHSPPRLHYCIVGHVRLPLIRLHQLTVLICCTEFMVCL